MRCEPAVKFAVVTALAERNPPILLYEMRVSEDGFELTKELLNEHELRAELPRNAREFDDVFDEIDDVLPSDSRALTDQQ